MQDFIQNFATSLGADGAPVLAAVRDYEEWRVRQTGAPFQPDSSDDVEVRSYLTQLRSTTQDPARVREAITSLKRFYSWARDDGVIVSSPFSEFNFDRQLLSREQIRRRGDLAPSDPQEREVARLQGLNKLGDQLNRSADIGSALHGSLTTLVEAMQLKTAWAFFWKDAGIPFRGAPPDPPHGFMLVESCGLPAGLRQNECDPLRRSPRCHCQDLLCAGRLVRAVNVVECTRLRAAAREAGDTEGLQFHATLPLVSQGKTFGMINVATEKWELLSAADLHFLSAAGAQVGAAIERARLYEVAERQRARFARELEMARRVQESLLPSHLPVIPGFSIAAEWQSAGEVAGDFYDIFPLERGRWAFVIADVSGKGAPAALYMAMTRTLIRAEADHEESPSKALAAVNERLKTQSGAHLFVTAFYGVLDPTSGLLTYSLAGHDPPLLRRASGEITTLSAGGLMLGPFEDAHLADLSIQLDPGDTFVTYTDGVVESTNARGEFFGLERLLAAFGRAPQSATSIMASLLEDVAIFAGAASRADDLTVVVLERHGSTGKR